MCGSLARKHRSTEDILISIDFLAGTHVTRCNTVGWRFAPKSRALHCWRRLYPRQAYCFVSLLNNRQLLPYDIAASKAHATMLKSINVLTQDELEKLLAGLDEILQLWKEATPLLPSCSFYRENLTSCQAKRMDTLPSNSS